MFCRKCGKTLLDGDRFCSYCGAQVIDRNETIDMVGSFEEVIYNNESDAKDKNVSTDNKEIKERDIPIDESVPTMNITQTWQEINENRADKQPRPPWNLDGFPIQGSEPKKTEDIKVDWEKSEPLKFDTSRGEEKPEERATVEAAADIREEHTEASAVEIPIAEKPLKRDIFELFDRQMEAEEAEIASKNTVVFERAAKPMPMTGAPGEEQIDKFYTFSKKNEEFQKLLDKEYERLNSEPNFQPCEGKLTNNIEKLEIKMPQAVMPAEPTKIKVIEERIETPEPLKWDGRKQEELKADEPKPKAIEPKPEEPKAIEPNLEELKLKEPKPELEIEAKNTKNDKNAEMQEKPQEKNEDTEVPPVLPWDGEESFAPEFIDDERDKKLSPLAIILGIIIAVLAFEVAVLGIKCFFPESGAAAFINKNLGVTVNWIDALKNDEKNQKPDAPEKDDPTEAEKKPDAETVSVVPTPDPLPSIDKAALVAEALPYNKNIKSVTADDTLAYDPNKDYRDKSINNSKTIENNIWYTDENGNATYYDKEIVETIIAFDSSWIDYVNLKDEAVFGLLKEGSSIYKNSKNFSKVGKITETFDVLKIGEIRQSETGFYVWVYEEISVTEKSKVKMSTYNYIYYMEPVDKQMKIVSCKQV